MLGFGVSQFFGSAIRFCFELNTSPLFSFRFIIIYVFLLFIDIRFIKYIILTEGNKEKDMTVVFIDLSGEAEEI